MQKGWNRFVVSNASDKRYYLGVSSRAVRLIAIGLPLLILGGFLLSILSVKDLKTDKTQLQNFLIEKASGHKTEIGKRDSELAILNEQFAELLSLETQLREVAGVDSLGITPGQEGGGGQGGRGGSNGILRSSDTRPHEDLLLKIREYSPDELLHEMSITRESFSDLLETLRKEQQRLASIPSINPVACPDAWFSSGFGYRKDPLSGKRRFHEGIDIVAWRNTPIIAPADGVVVFSGWRSGLGNAIEIEHGHGYMTTYGHNEKLMVKKGDHVTRGDKIALLGNSGRSTGPHLHYEISLNGKLINPYRYVKK